MSWSEQKIKILKAPPIGGAMPETTFGGAKWRYSSDVLY